MCAVVMFKVHINNTPKMYFTHIIAHLAKPFIALFLFSVNCKAFTIFVLFPLCSLQVRWKILEGYLCLLSNSFWSKYGQIIVYENTGQNIVYENLIQYCSCLLLLWAWNQKWNPALGETYWNFWISQEKFLL